jgi:uracil-DNA glycosylase family 4
LKKNLKKSTSPAEILAAGPTEPPIKCDLCPRLVQYRKENEKTYPDYFNGAAPSFGPNNAALLVVGLAPGLHGANRTGRPFTGDYAGELLYAMLEKYRFSNGRFRADPHDGLELYDAVVTNAVHCAPPHNRPLGAEINMCRRFLKNRLYAMERLRAILCLGRISHETSLAALGLRRKDAPFAHGAAHGVPHQPIRLFDSYHCSRYNTNTGRLTAAMFESVFAAVRRFIDTGKVDDPPP